MNSTVPVFFIIKLLKSYDTQIAPLQHLNIFCYYRKGTDR